MSDLVIGFRTEDESDPYYPVWDSATGETTGEFSAFLVLRQVAE